MMRHRHLQLLNVSMTTLMMLESRLVLLSAADFSKVDPTKGEMRVYLPSPAKELDQ